MAQSPELQAQIAAWRQRAREGTLTQDEMRQIIITLRKDRAATTQSTAGSRVTKERKVAATKPDANALLAKFALVPPPAPPASKP